MIFDKEPTSWKHLQKVVHQAFVEMRCHAEEPKVIDLVRGQKEIDVYVEDVLHGIKNVYLIECKYWKSDIPQEVIHGFRTVVADSGANKGIIITRSDFQSGAFEASKSTQIELMTWEQFNTSFFGKWSAAAQITIREKVVKLYEFRSMPYGDMCDEKLVELTPKEHDLWWEYINGFSEVGILAGARNVLIELNTGPVKVLRPRVQLSAGLPIEFWTIKTHREWFDYIVPKLDYWLEKIDEWMLEFNKRRRSPENSR